MAGRLDYLGWALPFFLREQEKYDGDVLIEENSYHEVDTQVGDLGDTPSSLPKSSIT